MIESQTPPDSTPTPEERRRAVCDAMAGSPGLIRFASRFTHSIDDAEDAYQRAMEIALTKAPVTERERFLAWLRTVLKNEALAISGAQARETTGLEEDVADAALPASRPGPEAAIEWKARYLTIQDAIAQLTEPQRICLMLQSGGSSYARISEITGYSARKVERSVVEGRGRLRSWEIRIEQGEVCRRLDGAIERAARNEEDRGERRAVRRHVRHCHGCRTLLASRRRRVEGFAGLVPAALLAEPIATANPDPGPYLAAWDRAFGGLTVRAGQLIQLGLELPGSTLGRVAAGAGAAALAIFTAVPLVADFVEKDPPAAADPAALVRSNDSPPSGAQPASRALPAGRAQTDASVPATPARDSQSESGPSVAATVPDPSPAAGARKNTSGPARKSSQAPAPSGGQQSSVVASSERQAVQPTRVLPAAARQVASVAAEAPSPAAAPAPTPPAASAAPAPAAPEVSAADVVIPSEVPSPGPDGAVIYGD